MASAINSTIKKPMEELYRSGRKKVEYDSTSIRFVKGLTITSCIIECGLLICFGIPVTIFVFFLPGDGTDSTFFKSLMYCLFAIVFIHHGTPWTLKNYFVTVDTIIDFKNYQITLVNIFGRKKTIYLPNNDSFDFTVKKVFLFDHFRYYLVLIHRSSRAHVNIFDMSVSKEEIYKLVDSIKELRNSIEEKQ